MTQDDDLPPATSLALILSALGPKNMEANEGFSERLLQMARDIKFRETIGEEPDLVIHKVRLPAIGEIEIPQGSRVVSAAEQNGSIFIWYMFPVQAAELPKQIVPVALIGTGQKVDHDFHVAMDFYQSVHMKNGEVWHIFFGHSKYADDK